MNLTINSEVCLTEEIADFLKQYTNVDSVLWDFNNKQQHSSMALELKKGGNNYMSDGVRGFLSKADIDRLYCYDEYIEYIEDDDCLNEAYNSIYSVRLPKHDIEGIEIFGDERGIYIVIDDVLFEKGNDDLILLWYPSKKKGQEYVIPYNVKAIMKYAFSSNPYIETIFVGKGVERIVPCSFYKCNNLRNIIVEDGNPFYYSMDGVLYATAFQWDCDKYFIHHHYVNRMVEKRFTDEMKNMIGDVLFCYPMNHSSKSFTMPSGVKYIAHYAFFESNIEYIQLSENLEFIAERSFKNCKTLKGICLTSDEIPIVEVCEDPYAEDELTTPFDGCSEFISIMYQRGISDDTIEFWKNLFARNSNYLSNFTCL